MSDWIGRAALGLIVVLLAGLIGGYVIADFATGRSLHGVYYGYEMPDDGAGKRSTVLNAERERLDRIAVTAPAPAEYPY